MKKYISAPLCSALVIPGLGQLLNRDMKKGLILLGTVFILINLAGVKLYLIVDAAISEAATQGLSGATLVQQVRSSDFTLIRVLAGLFLLTWAYAVGDAFIKGRKIESAREDGEQ
ncbi:MAG: hypothetical protein ACQET7_00060 [Thermodesulfobacteriota bacterium]